MGKRWAAATMLLTMPGPMIPISPVALFLIDIQQGLDDPRWGARNKSDAERRIGAFLLTRPGPALSSARGTRGGGDNGVLAQTPEFNDGNLGRDQLEQGPRSAASYWCVWPDLIATEAERLAALEVQENDKLIQEMLEQLRYIPEWCQYFVTGPEL